MNKRIKTKWCKWLRSGEIDQGIGQLLITRQDGSDEFCGLGVLCEIHARETGNAWDEDNGYFGKKTDLPEVVMKWAGLSESDPTVSPTGLFGSNSLANMNDCGFTLPEIADTIEAQF